MLYQTYFGIGTDIIEIKRFENLDFSFENKFLVKIFTKNELKDCFSRSKPARHLAVRFAGKEAIIKAISESKIKLNLTEIEILNEYDGRPIVDLKSKEFENFEIKISLSHSNDNAIAFATVYEKI